MKPFDFRVPTKILFGRGRVRELAGRLRPGWGSVMIVTDSAAAEKSGALAAVPSPTR
jgi:alcohol dehydrogenase YqhD (iron-dependent ADH family)